MAEIKYDTPQVQPSIEGMMLASFKVVRYGFHPNIVLTYSEGYRPMNGGEVILNDIGQPAWLIQGRTIERTVPLTDANLQAAAAFAGLDMMAFDDKIVAAANKFFTENVLTTQAVVGTPLAPTV